MDARCLLQMPTAYHNGALLVAMHLFRFMRCQYVPYLPMMVTGAPVISNCSFYRYLLALCVECLPLEAHWQSSDTVIRDSEQA